MITCIRLGWYKIFPQPVISFSFITLLDFARSRGHPSKELGPVGEYSHDVTAAILVFQNNVTAAILVFHTNPVGDGLFSRVKISFVPILNLHGCWPRE